MCSSKIVFQMKSPFLLFVKALNRCGGPSGRPALSTKASALECTKGTKALSTKIFDEDLVHPHSASISPGCLTRARKLLPAQVEVGHKSFELFHTVLQQSTTKQKKCVMRVA